MGVNNQSGPLKHLCTETHFEAQFAELINRIPKSASQHDEQAQHIRNLADTANWRVHYILDVGGGEGKFTALALDLLRQNGAIEGAIHVDVIEKDDTLWQKCESLLTAAGATCRRVPIFQDNNSTFELPKDREHLLLFADRWKEGLSKAGTPLYDLLIGSHVTYYFDNAGADLAYALGSRLLTSAGHSWFVVRDRDCPFYRYRDNLLVRSHLSDIHRDCFSDSFLDRLRCMVPDLGGAIPSIYTQQRTLALDVTGDAPALVSYLMWLSGLSPEQISEAAKEGSRDRGFAETHIWVSQITPIKKRESHVLTEIDIIGRCIDLLRRAAPDLQTHRVFLASVEPKGSTPNAEPVAAADIEKARPFKTFALWSVGYACKFPISGDADLLDKFFTKNTSFLFYPRFYHDYGVNCPNPTSVWTDYSLVEKLDGEPRYKSPTGYPLRYIETGTRKNFPPTIAEPNPSPETQMPAFSESHSDWVEKQSAHYCKEPTPGGNPASMWSICVGCNILPDFRHVISTDQMLNSCCALFLTVSTEGKLKELAPRFVGQVKARLAQWIAEALYERLQERMDELKKQAQMLELMQRPLRRISEALSTMQSDTQELRALMFEPEESLFASFSQIAPFFVEGQPLSIDLANQGRIDIHHSPDDYTDTELPIVLACVLCAVFGELDRLKPLRRASLVLAVAAGVLDDVSEKSATSGLAADLKWLVGLTDGAGNPDPQRSLSSLLSGSTRSEQTMALTYIKQALFSPFKTGASAWDPIAFRLLARHAKLGGSILNETLLGSAYLRLPTSPVSYAAVLAFVRDIAVALTTASRKVTSLAWFNSSGVKECVMTFSTTIPTKGQDGIDRSRLAEVLEDVSRCPREWRIQDANYGDTTRPFVYLVNKVLGLRGPEVRVDGANGEDANSDDARWVVEEPRAPEVFAIRQPTGQGRRFVVECPADRIVLKWTKP